ncbi:MAG: hypothetical protein M5U01_04495 [Ardenticatenaceae bacterium]|nr:hypothetical protein [Ardenticatenaceae bacterium]
MSVELIPGGKFPLTVATPVLPAPGIWAPDSPLPLAAIGAVVTPPLGWIWDGDAAEVRPRPGAIVWEPPRRPLERFLERLRRERDPHPRIVTLAADGPRQVADAALLVEAEADVAALLIWWQPSTRPADLLTAVRSMTALPLLVELPADLAPARARAVAAAGADALLIGPPRALLSGGRPARLWGPAILPLVERALDSLANRGPPLPLLAAGGIASGDDALRLCEAGAVAVAVGPEWWVQPDLPDQIAAALA